MPQVDIWQQREDYLYKLKSEQKGMTLVEILITVAILSILGLLSGLFLMKFLPEYRLRSATNTLVQDLRSTQVGALKKLETWKVEFSIADNKYIVKNGSGSTVKTVYISNYGESIKINDVNNVNDIITFNAEGQCPEEVSIIIKNDKGTASTVTVFLTGAIRADL